MIYIGEAILILFCVIIAWFHADLIKDRQRIKKNILGVVYFLLSITISYLNHSYILFLLSLFIRPVFYSVSLRLFLGSRIAKDYIIYFLFIVFLNFLL